MWDSIPNIPIMGIGHPKQEFNLQWCHKAHRHSNLGFYSQWHEKTLTENWHGLAYVLKRNIGCCTMARKEAERTTSKWQSLRPDSGREKEVWGRSVFLILFKQSTGFSNVKGKKKKSNQYDVNALHLEQWREKANIFIYFALYLNQSEHSHRSY